MKRIVERVAGLGEQRRRAHLNRLAARVRELLPDARVEDAGAGLSVSGRNLLTRWLNSAELRFIGAGL